MRDAKEALRGAVLAQRESLSSASVRAWGERIQRSVIELPLYRAARAVALYSPLGNEVGTSEISRDALEARKRLYYPKVTDGSPRVVRVRSEAELVPGRYGIPEPAGSQPWGSRPCEDRGLAVFVPGVAFDRNGNRLGRGTGWYDRLLDSLGPRAPRIALAYEFQLLEEVPAEPGDRPVHYIVTEDRVVACGGTERVGGPCG